MTDYSATDPAHDQKSVSPLLVALAGWVVPGLGYLLVGERWRALVAGLAILVLIMLGVLIGGVRVVELPGYDSSGNAILIKGTNQWVLTARPFPTLMSEVWFVPQILNGPVTLIIGQQSLSLTRSGVATKMHGRLDDIGVLYVAIAGVLNLLVIIDSAHRASKN